MLKSTKPVSVQDQYTQNSQIDFKLTHPGQSLKAGSIKLSGELYIVSTADDSITTGTGVALSHIGAHSLIRSATVSLQNNMVETLSYYARYVAELQAASMTDLNVATSSDMITELRTLSDTQSNELIRNSLTTEGVYTLPFSMRLNVCVNNTNADLPYSKTGDIFISLQLAQSQEAIYSATPNSTVTTPFTYYLKNLKLNYVVMDTDKAAGDITMQVKQLFKGKIDTSVSTFAITSPLVCSSINGSVIRQAHEASYLHDANALEDMNITRAELSIYSSDSIYKFPLQSSREVLYNGLMSLSNSTRNAVNAFKSSDNANHGDDCSYVIGYDFMSSIPAPAKMSLTLYNTLASSSTPFSLFVYVMSLVKL